MCANQFCRWSSVEARRVKYSADTAGPQTVVFCPICRAIEASLALASSIFLWPMIVLWSIPGYVQRRKRERAAGGTVRELSLRGWSISHCSAKRVVPTVYEGRVHRTRLRGVLQGGRKDFLLRCIAEQEAERDRAAVREETGGSRGPPFKVERRRWLPCVQWQDGGRVAGG
jgi:hypothetical protein